MINKMIVQGRLTKAVELKTTPGGIFVTSFVVAWSEKRGDKEEKLFLPCVAWRGAAEILSRYFKKGSEVLLEGKLTTRQWEYDGQRREAIQMTVDTVHFCGPKQNEQTSLTPDFLEYTGDDCPF